jgi:hypothetical protein
VQSFTNGYIQLQALKDRIKFPLRYIFVLLITKSISTEIKTFLKTVHLQGEQKFYNYERIKKQSSINR